MYRFIFRPERKSHCKSYLLSYNCSCTVDTVTVLFRLIIHQRIWDCFHIVA